MPDPPVDVARWSEQNIELPQAVAANAGAFRVAKTPYLREIFDCLSPEHPCERVVVRKGAQLGFTTAGIAWLGSLARLVGGPMGMFLPTVELAKGYVKTKLNPVVDSSPGLDGFIYEQKSRDGRGSTQLYRGFPGGFWHLSGANSSAGLQMFTLRFLMKDELSEWQYDVEGRGDPSYLADSRTNSYQLVGRKIYEPSTPGSLPGCRITAKFMAGDQRLYNVPCLHCGTFQTIAWERFQYRDSPPYDARLECIKCGTLIPYRELEEMLEPGEWRALNPLGLYPSFDINGFYSPFMSWDAWVFDWFQSRGDVRKEKAFRQQGEGLPTEEAGEAPPWKTLFDRREDYPLGRIPPGGLALTAGIDVQGDRIEVEVVAWSHTLESWSVTYEVIEGDPTQAKVWQALDVWLARTYVDQWGRAWRVDMVAIDSGHLARMVYRWARLKSARVIAVKGAKSPNAPYLARGNRQQVTVGGRKHGVPLWLVGTHQMKLDIYDYLRLEREQADGVTATPLGYCHFPKAYGETYFKGLVSERLEDVTINGRPAKHFVVTAGVRNEPLDCRVYAMAAAERLGIFYWSEGRWRDRIAERGPPDMADTSELPLFAGGAGRPAAIGEEADDYDDPGADDDGEPMEDDAGDAGSIED